MVVNPVQKRPASRVALSAVIPIFALGLSRSPPCTQPSRYAPLVEEGGATLLPAINLSFARAMVEGCCPPPHRILVLSLSLLSLGEHGGQILGLDNRQNVDFARVSSNLPLPDNSSTTEGRNVLQDSSFGTLRLSAKRNVPQPPVHLILSLASLLSSFLPCVFPLHLKT